MRLNVRARCERGTALLTVLWLVAALSAIAFTVANTVRAETDRVSTSSDELKAYYLASGSVDRALLWIQWGGGHKTPDGQTMFYESPMSQLHFVFPSGEANVEIIPESAKLDVNKAAPQDLMNLIANLGVPADQAQNITAAILDWRTASGGGAFTAYDEQYLAINPTFRPHHASLEEIEELLNVRGVTPELFYGSYVPLPDGRLWPQSGLRDCLSVYGVTGGFDVNTVNPALMRAIGINPDAVAVMAAMRQRVPFRSANDLAPFQESGPGFGRLAITPSSIATLRATARLRLPDGRLSEVTRSVAALIKFWGWDQTPPYQILRWYDNAFSPQ